VARVVVVDLDGTMVDTAPDFQAAINQMRAQFGAAGLSEDVIKTFVGKGSEHLIRKALAVDHNPAEVEAMMPTALTSYQVAYASVNGLRSSVYPGVREGLVRLGSGGRRLACVTNKPHRFAVDLLDKTELLAHFDLVLGGDSVAEKKPDPEPLHMVCRHFGVEPHRVAAIGDSSNDAQAARAAGCQSITVSYGYNHGQDVRGLDTDAIVDSLLEAALWIENYQSGLVPAHESL
jgi:phosphoglycolate phosphatase